MECNITGNKESLNIRIYPHLAYKEGAEKKVYSYQDSAELKYYSFQDIHLILIRADTGRVTVFNHAADSFVTAYGVLTGDLKSENASGEVTYFYLTAGQHSLYYPASLISTFHMDGPLHAFILYIPDTYVKRLLWEESGISSFLIKHLKKHKAFITETLPVVADINKIINSLYNSKLKGDIFRIFLEAKILEYLSIQLEQLDMVYRQRSTASFLRGNDIDKIQSAKAFIESNIQTPCSLIELSRKVGLNDFKLKKGFKEILGTTVFGYLSEIRMERAKVLLEQKRTVSEVAFEVGYKNPHHFTAAFKKKFGILPSAINR